MIERISRELKVKFLSTEGVVADKCAFAKNVISFITIRNPIDRIFSLYWYEHVDFYYNIKKEPSKTKQFQVWMEAWLDGSKWKTDINVKHPYENYVEIENYYVKTLIGWKGDENRAINKDDYIKACSLLQKYFDVVFITEWLPHKNQSVFLDSIIPNVSKSIVSEVVGKIDLKEKLSKSLVGDSTSVERFKRLLEEKNLYDIMLWRFAQEMVRERATLLSDLKIIPQPQEAQYDSCKYKSSMNLKSCRDATKLFGLFQTAGHKGPF